MGDTSLARTRHTPSPIRHAGVLRAFGLEAGPLVFAPPQPAGWAHLVSLRSGAAALRTDGRLAFLGPHRATWIPAGTRYAIDLRSPCSLRIAYVAADVAPEHGFGAVEMPPLLAEILERAVRSGYLDPRVSRDARLLAVAYDELVALRPVDGPVALAMPRDAGLLRAVDLALRAAPDGVPTIATLAAAAAMSARTFERRFGCETGLSPRAWVRRARLDAARAAIAAGASLTDASFAAGYTSASAFGAAYRDVFGTTPGRRVRPGGAITPPA